MEVNGFESSDEHLSTNLEQIRAMIRVVQAATERGGWWGSPRGQNALKALRGWGATERVRMVTGDPSAVPGNSKGLRGARSVGSVSSIAMIHASVHAWMRSCTDDQARLLWWIYAANTEELPLVVAYVLGNGSISDPVEASAPVPSAFQAYQRQITLAEGWVQTKRTGEFADEHGLGDRLLKFGLDWNWFIEHVHLSLAMKLARDLDL